MPKNTNRGLGTGLGALFGEESGQSGNDFDYIPIAKIEPRADQPRSVFDQKALEELADSVREHGVIQPLTLRRLDAGFYQIVAGERRWRAAKQAGLVEVPARIIEADNRKSSELALVENLMREDLNPIEEAAGYKALINEHGLTQEEVSKRIGKSRSNVTNTMRLLSLPDETLKLVERGELSAGSARALLGLTEPDEINQTAKKIVRKTMTVREVETFVERLKREKPGAATKKQQIKEEVNYIVEAEHELSLATGRSVKITAAKMGGKITLDYYDDADFNVLYDKLKAINH